MTLLPRTPAPHPTESLLGYALRVSETNGYDSPWHVFSLAGFEQSEIVSPGFKVNKLASVLGCTPELLKQYTYRAENGNKEFQLRGHVLGGSLTYSPLRLKKPALCQCCAAETGFIDAFWDLSAAIACPTHGTRLLSDCPVCNTPLTWFRPGLLKCKCGENLNRVVTQPASKEEIDLMRLLYAKLHRTSKPEVADQSLPVDALWALPLRSILELLVAIGNQALKTGSVEQIDGRTDVMRAATATLSNWPANFHEFLRKLDKHTNADGISIRKRFSDFYTSMFKQRKNSADFIFLREEMIRFGSEEWGDGLVDHRMLDGVGEDQRYMSRQMLAKRINVDPRTLNKWASTGRVNLKEVVLGEQRRFIADAAGFTVTIKAEGEIIQERQAAQQLELPVSVLHFLKESRHYAPVHTPPYKGGYHELDLKNFHQVMLEKSTLLEVIPSEAVFKLEYVMQEIRFWSKNGKGEFIAAYLNGHIESLGRLGNTISSILFRKSEVERIVQECRTKASGGAISLKEACEKLGCNALAIKGLARDGYLEVVPGPDRLRVTHQSIEELMSTHISLLAIAKEHCSSTRRLHRLCMAQRIKTLRIPHEGSGESIFIAVDSKEELVTSLLDERPTERPTAEQALKSYLADLQKDSQTLPRRAGKPCLTAIASACNFERSAFYKNKVVSRLLEEYQQQEAVTHSVSALRTPSEALSTFLMSITTRGEKLPLRGSNPNLKEIAKQCNFKRDWFYVDPALREMLVNHLTANADSI